MKGVNLPEVFIGETPIIDNQAFLEYWQKKEAGTNVAFLVPSGGKLYRASTLLKYADGSYRDGSEVDDDYAETVMRGQDYSGIIMRSGKMYALAVLPFKDVNGRMAAAVSMRVPIDESLKQLKANLAKIVIGKTGAPLIVSRAVGDMEDPFFVLHATHEGEAVKSLPEALRKIIEDVLLKGSGFITYDWYDSRGTYTKIAAFTELPALHWIVMVTAPLEEFTAPYDTIQRWMIAGIALLVLLVLLGIGLFVHWQLKPMAAMRRTVSDVAENLDLTRRLGDESADEIGQVSTSVDQMLASFRKAVQDVAAEIADVHATMKSVHAAAERVAQGSSA
ncbi:MAG: Cache 3/Cache 2 fusion domain-containing protein, partial [Candidatus Accumulibacter sp.]|nr:Cache 3/Cache 2 fusion domain-containing protein [Accumulibacter sp.]